MKRKAIFSIIVLVLCLSAFSIPAYAADTLDTTPPTLTASTLDGALHIEAVDADSGVQAVFIDGQRINYRVDSALDVVFADYAKGEIATIYAIDFGGNKSQEVQVKNPDAPPEPAVPSEQKPFTPSGTGTVQDNVTDADGKEFFTVITPDDNAFFLVIDHQRESENVYLLNAVTEEDLGALAAKGEKSTPAPTPQPTPAPTPEPQPEKPPAKGTNAGTIFFILLAAAAVGGAGYYFKIYKPKQQAALPDEFDEDEDYQDDSGDEDYLSDRVAEGVNEDNPGLEKQE